MCQNNQCVNLILFVFVLPFMMLLTPLIVIGILMSNICDRYNEKQTSKTIPFSVTKRNSLKDENILKLKPGHTHEKIEYDKGYQIEPIDEEVIVSHSSPLTMEKLKAGFKES